MYVIKSRGAVDTLKAVIRNARGNGGAGYLTTSLVSISGGGNDIRGTLQTAKKPANLVRFTGGSLPNISVEQNVLTTGSAVADTKTIDHQEAGGDRKPNIKELVIKHSEGTEIIITNTSSVQADIASFTSEATTVVTACDEATQAFYITSDDGGMLFSTS